MSRATHTCLRGLPRTSGCFNAVLRIELAASLKRKRRGLLWFLRAVAKLRPSGRLLRAVTDGCTSFVSFRRPSATSLLYLTAHNHPPQPATVRLTSLLSQPSS